MIESDVCHAQKMSDEQTTTANILQRFFRRLRFDSIEELDVPIDPNETGWDRLKNSWQTFNRGESNLEFLIIGNAISMAAFTGFAFGAMTQNQQVFQSFVQKHNTNVFHGKFQANRQLSDTMFIELFVRSIKHAIRYGLFGGTFVGTLTLAATYRNDLYYRDCALAGAMTGILWKSHLGLRASIVNATLGSLFGLSFAAIMRLLMKLTNTSIRQMRYIHQNEKDMIDQ